MKHKLLFACAFLIFSLSKATTYLTSVEVERLTDCEIAAKVNIKGLLPATNYQIDSIVFSNLVTVPGPGETVALGNNYLVYVSEIEGVVGTPETIPFDTTMTLLHGNLQTFPFASSSIGAMYFLNGENVEQVSSSTYLYSRPSGCTYINPEPVTACDSIEISVTHFYDPCSGYEYIDSETEIKGDTIFIRKSFRLPENPIICFGIWGPSYARTKIGPLAEGYFTIVSEFIVNGGVVSGDKYYAEVAVIEGECPITGFDKEVQESLFYPSLVESVITVSNSVSNARIYTLSGQPLLTSVEHEIDIEALSEGVYIIELTLDNTVVRKQFVKQ